MKEMKTKEEIEKEARWRFTDGHGATDEYSVGVFVNACEWLKESIQQEWIQVVAVQDDSGHWYVIPKELYQTFRKDLNDEHFVDSGKFDETYGQYRTGGDLNLTQLYIPNPTKS